MLNQALLARVVLFTLARSSLAHPSAWSRWLPWSGQQPAQGVYVQTNDVSANAIIAMSIGTDGMVSGGSMIATGGKGSNLIGANGKPDFPDALSSQDAVVCVGNYVFAVNAGSNSLSMFSVSTSNPTDVQLLGEPQSTNGDFPTSVAVSMSLGMACVANTGIQSGVACATFSAQGLSAFDSLRSMNFGATQNPPLGPTPGVGDIFFSEDDSCLVVMVKGNKSPAFTGFAAKFDVQDRQVATSGTQTTPPGSVALFGTALIPGSANLVYASDAAFGGLLLNLNDLAAPPLAVTNVTGQKASCWSQISSVTGTGFITDPGVNRLVEVNIQNGAIIREYYPPNPFAGMTDFRTDGGYLWALAGSNGTFPASIVAFDISKGPGTAVQIQTYAIPGAGVNTQGLAVLL